MLSVNDILNYFDMVELLEAGLTRNNFVSVLGESIGGALFARFEGDFNCCILCMLANATKKDKYNLLAIMQKGVNEVKRERGD